MLPRDIWSAKSIILSDCWLARIEARKPVDEMSSALPATLATCHYDNKNH